MRAFIALQPDPAALAVLQADLRRLRQGSFARDVKWVREDNLHATMRFLDDIDDAQKIRLIELLSAQAPALGPASILRMSEPRLFPKPAQARTIACIIERDAWLSRLAEVCEGCAQAIGLPAEHRPFTGHITLGRTRDSFQWRTFQYESRASTRLLSSHMTLFKSTLTPQGPIYEALSQIDFAHPIEK
jgi:2'-5' RNA ligase